MAHLTQSRKLHLVLLLEDRDVLSVDVAVHKRAGRSGRISMNSFFQNNQGISVIIPNYNRSDALPATLRSLTRQSINTDSYEVVLVDDGSNDGSLRFVEQLRPELPYQLTVLQQRNCGPSRARNLGAQAAHHNLLVFWDSDMIAAPAALREHSRLQEVSGPVLVAGARRPWPEACKTAFMKTMYWSRLEMDQFSGKTPSFQEVFSSNLSIPRASFAVIGGFDESLRAYEDIDFAYRAQKAGIALLFSREALGYHNHPMTLEQACAQQRHYQSYAPALLHKHPELAGKIQHLVDKTPVRWRVDKADLIARKLIRQVLATRWGISVLTRAANHLESLQLNQKLRASIYMAVLSSCAFHGFRRGLQMTHTPTGKQNAR